MSRNISGTHYYALRPYTVQGKILTDGNYILLRLLFTFFVLFANVAVRQKEKGFCFLQPCFSKNSQLTSLNCPFCKKRIGTWHRRAKNVDTLINQHLWTYIRDNFGDKVNARMNAEEVDGEIFQVRLHRIYFNLFYGGVF